MAAFKNLTERFEAKMNDLYGKYSTKDLPDGNRGNEPYLETKPNNPNKWNFGGPRTKEMDAITADVERLTKFSTNKPLWYLDQQNLQSGNTFGETRVVNPLFVIGNAQPYFHIKRSLADAASMDLGGAVSNNHPGSTNNIGSAGRLQKETSTNIVRTIKTGGHTTIWDALARIAPPNRLFNTISMVSNVLGERGPLSVNQRPEMDMNGTGEYNSLFSVKMWSTRAYNGFTAVDTPTNNLARAGVALSQGNIRQAGNILLSLVSRPAVVRSDSISNIPESVDTPLPGKRYFIKDTDSSGQSDQFPATRYLKNSVILGNYGDYVFTKSNLRLNHTPYLFVEPIITLAGELAKNVVQPTSNTATTSQQNTQRATARATTARRQVTRNANTTRNTATTTVLRGPAAALRIINLQTSQLLGQSVQLRANTVYAPSRGPDNPAEEKMEFPELSLRQKYNANEFVVTTQPIETQKTTWLDTLKSIAQNFSNTRGAGFKGGLLIDGNPVTINPGAKNPFTIPQQNTTRGTPRYAYDNINSYPVVPSAKSSTGLTREAINAMKEVHGVPLVDLYFFDFVNKVAVPFRANITNLSETTSPEFTDNFYIGRTERNIIYTGVRRELSLAFIIHAYNEVELSGIWAKLNYLTSLCFPSDYSNGFMVPPLIKLTLGDIYNNQPGYIRSLTYNVDPDTPWETTENFQVPHGINVSLGYSVIEKVPQKSSKYVGYDPVNPPRYFVPLYNYGNPRLSDPPSPPLASGRATPVAARCAVPAGSRTNGVSNEYIGPGRT